MHDDTVTHTPKILQRVCWLLARHLCGGPVPILTGFVLLTVPVGAQSTRGGSAIGADTAYIQWDPPQQISFDPYISVRPRIAAVDNYVYIMWVGATTPYSFFARSTDHGQTWSQPFLVTDTARFFASSAYDASEDYLYFVTTYRPPPYIEYVWMRISSDRGLSWQPGRILFEGIDEREVAAHAINVVLDFEFDSLPLQTRFAHSADRAQSWTQFPVTFPPGMPPGGMTLVDSVLHQVREVGSLAYPEVAYGQSRDFGATWRPEVIISQNDSLVSDEMHVAADSAGNVYAVWRDERGGCIGGLDCAVMFRKSTDFGVTWLPSVELSDHGSKGGVARVSSSGNVVATCWYTSTAPSRIRARVSLDFGSTWSQIYTLSPLTIPSRSADIAVSGNYLHLCWFQEDNPPVSSEIYYRRGRVVTTDVHEQTDDLPYRLRLLQNYPNPFNSSTTIEYHLPTQAHVTLKVYNVLGQEVALLVAESKPAGVHRIQFDASTLSRPLASGLYCYRLSVHDGRGQIDVQSKRMLYLK